MISTSASYFTNCRVEHRMPATMTPTNNIIDLITTEADQKPRTWRGVSSPPPAAAAAVSSLSLLDLTAKTTPPISAQEIINNDDLKNCVKLQHALKNPPGIWHLPGTSKYAQTNTLRALAPVTHLLPWKKKLRPLQCRSSGKENWGSDVFFCGNESPMVND